MILLFKISVTKPVNNNNETSRSVPPPRPAPPVTHHQSTPPSRPEPPLLNEFKDEPLLSESPPETEFDLLNLGSTSAEKPKPPPVPEPPKITKTKEPSFDLLGGFDSNFQDPYPDLLGTALNKPTEPAKVTSSGNDLDDIFGSISSPPIATSKSSSDLNGLNLNFGAGNSTKTENTFNDPFADFTSSLKTEMKSEKSTPIHQQFIPPPMTSSSSATPRNNPSTPIHNIKSPSEPQRPDYSRSHFQEKVDPAQNQKSKPADIFGDILGSQGYSFGNVKNQGPRSINEMRKVEQAQTMDPERLKVMEWVSESNLN